MPYFKEPNLPMRTFREPNPEVELVGRLRTGDQNAFNELYKNYAATLLGAVMKIVRQQETAEDVLQEVFLKIRKYMPIYDEHKARLFTWMLNIARNTAIDQIRSKHGRQNSCNIHMEDAENELQNYTNDFNPDTVGIRTLLNNLNDKQRTVFHLAYYNGYTHQEIAETLDMPLGSVKTTIRQGILVLRALFDFNDTFPKEIRKAG